MQSLRKLFQGLGFLLEGFRILKTHPHLLVFVIIPLTIDVAAFAGGVFLGTTFVSAWVASALSLVITPAAGIWYSVFYYPLLALLWVAFLVVLGYAVFLIGAVIASPFHSLLAERTLMKLGALQTTPFNLRASLRAGFTMFKISLKKMLVFAVLGVVILVCSFIPIVNIAASFAACMIVAFDAMDYSFELKEWGLSQRFAFFKAELPLFLGMSMALGLTLLIPGLTLLFYPVAVVGAASNLSQSKRLREGI